MTLQTANRFSKPAVIICATAFFLSACSVPAIQSSSNRDSATVLAPGDSISVDFFTSVTNLDTGIILQEGNTYELDVVTLSNWIDGWIEENESGEAINEFGFSNNLMPLSFLGTTRRSRQHQWFELMLFQPRCSNASLRGVSDLSRNSISGNYQFVATCDGTLTLFVNDTYGFYSNNLGYANIALSRVN